MIYNKYRNKKTTVDGITFDSKKEAYRYSELIMLQKAGLISGLELQPKFHLIDKVKYNGKTLRTRFYVSDFRYIESGVDTVEDVKGYKTDVYKIKRQLFLTLYPHIRFIES